MASKYLAERELAPQTLRRIFTTLFRGSADVSIGE
jgi:hypothetical protein